jgi:hypothetical protein
VPPRVPHDGHLAKAVYAASGEEAPLTVFEFVFPLYSLLFGLALAQVFGGFGNTLLY